MDAATLAVILGCVEREIKGASQKFPNTDGMALTIAEEAGEVAAALNQQKFEKGENQAVFDECIHLAATAIRLAIEGVPEYPYAFDYDCYRDFKPTGSQQECESRVNREVGLIR
jgi:hypothetical protein